MASLRLSGILLAAMDMLTNFFKIGAKQSIHDGISFVGLVHWHMI